MNKHTNNFEFFFLGHDPTYPISELSRSNLMRVNCSNNSNNKEEIAHFTDIVC